MADTSLEQFVEGALVRRGPTWNWGDQDRENGTAPSLGRVVSPPYKSFHTDTYWVDVRWKDSSESYQYRVSFPYQDITLVRGVDSGKTLESFG